MNEHPPGAIQFATITFLTNWENRNTLDPYWRRLYRQFAMKALYELRYLTNRPSAKTREGEGYGQPEMN